VRKYFTSTVRLLRIAAVVLALTIVTDVALVHTFDREDLFLRTTGHSLASLPYLLQRYERHDGRSVVFLGASVVHGSSYTKPEQTAPLVVERLLRRRPETADVRCFNFAVPSATMGDLYCLLSHFKTNKPDLIVLTINPKFFCRAVFSEAPVRFPRMWGMTAPEDRARIASHDGLTFAQKQSALLNETIRRHWALPRWLPLWGERLSGAPNPLGEALMRNLAEPLGEEFVNPNRPKPFLREPYRWRKLSEVKVGYLYKAYAELPPREENTNFFFLEQILALARENDFAVLPYITPFNRPMNDERKILSVREYARFLQETLTVVRRNRYRLLNLTDAVESRWFGDLDHLLVEGHEQLAHALLEPIAAEVAR